MGVPNLGWAYDEKASNILENAAAPTPVAFGHLRASRPLAGWRARRVRKIWISHHSVDELHQCENWEYFDLFWFSHS